MVILMEIIQLRQAYKRVEQYLFHIQLPLSLYSFYILRSDTKNDGRAHSGCSSFSLNIFIIWMKNQKKKSQSAKVRHLSKQETLPLPYVELNLSTWLKDSHGLYDYEAPDTKCEKNTIKVSKSSKIYRNTLNQKTEVIGLEEPQLGYDYKLISILLINRETDTYQLLPASNINSENQAQVLPALNRTFTVLREYRKDGVEGFALSPGNVIRLGRVQFLVLEVRNNKNTQCLKQSNELELNTDDYKVQKSLEGSCKICLCEESTEEDPLINPCKCKGSCQFIHLGCLKNWINSKVKKEVNGIVCSYNFSKFECEICKGAFPKTVTMPNDQVLQMITIQKPEKPYLILESLGREDRKQRVLHLIYGTEGQNLKVGRGHQCELRVNDISVSRLHADVRFENNQFLVRDRQAKFGTLIEFRQPMEINEVSKLQFGRLVLEFKLKQVEPTVDIETNSEEMQPLEC